MEALRSRLINLLAEPKPGLEEIDAFFSELNAETCASLVRTIDGNHQRRLWEAAAATFGEIDSHVWVAVCQLSAFSHAALPALVTKVPK